MTRARLLLLLGVVLVGAVLWPVYRQSRVEGYRQELLAADAATKEIGIPIGGRFYRAGELQAAAAPHLVGPDAARHHSVEPPFDDPVAAIVDFRDRLADRGIELWVVPGPLRPWVAPHQVLDRSVGARIHPGIYDDAYVAFIDALEAEGVTTFDMLPAFRRGAQWSPSDWIHISDPHWTANGMMLATGRVASLLDERGWIPDTPPYETVAYWRQVERTASRGGIPLPDEPDETIWVHTVKRLEGEEKKTLPVDDPDAPVVIIGDSHVNWYYRFHGDFGRNLVHEAGIAVDTIPIVGGGATRSREELVRRSQAHPGYLDSKKVVIWTFWMEDVWSKPWGIVPLEPLPESKLVRRRGAARFELDQRYITDGRSAVSMDYRWREPTPGDEDADVVWIRKPDMATMVLPGPFPEGASLLVEAVGKGKKRRVDLRLDDEELDGFVVHPGATRVRIDVPPSEATTRRLFIGLHDEPRPTNVLGLRNLGLLRTRTVWEAELDPESEGFQGPLEEQGRRFATTGERFEVEADLGEVDGDVVVRARLRSTRGDGPLSLTVNGHLAMEREVRRHWEEQAIVVSRDWLETGVNRLVFETKGRGLAWDVLEIDAVPPR